MTREYGEKGNERKKLHTHTVMIDFPFCASFYGSLKMSTKSEWKKRPPRPPKRAQNRLGMVGVGMVTKGARKTEQRLDEEWIACVCFYSKALHVCLHTHSLIHSSQLIQRKIVFSFSMFEKCLSTARPTATTITIAAAKSQLNSKSGREHSDS